MKPFLFTKGALLCCAFSFATLAIGQVTNVQIPADAPSQSPVASGAVDIVVARKIMDDAKDLVRSGDIAQAEQKLGSLNIAPANTPDWHLETAQRLMQTAEQLARGAETTRIADITARTLQRIGLADTPQTPASKRAAARTLAGFIQERYLGDPDAALQSYQAAQQISPGAASSRAKEAADRIQRAKNNNAKKAQGGS